MVRCRYRGGVGLSCGVGLLGRSRLEVEPKGGSLISCGGYELGFVVAEADGLFVGVAGQDADHLRRLPNGAAEFVSRGRMAFGGPRLATLDLVVDVVGLVPFRTAAAVVDGTTVILRGPIRT